MNFYFDWYRYLINNIDDNSFKIKFLNKDELSLNAFNLDNLDELKYFYKIMTKVDINNFIEQSIKLENFISINDFLQFSDFNKAINDLPHLLFSKNNLTFSEIGKYLINGNNDIANKKYGENHAKLAKEISVVDFIKNGITKVKITTLGIQLLSQDDFIKSTIIKKLLLRNNLIREIIKISCSEIMIFRKIAVNYLAESTIVRRSRNIKFLVEYILKGTKYEINLERMIWK